MRCACILTGPDTYLDHLGVLSSLLQLPLIVTEGRTYESARQHYPDLDVSLKNLDELSIEFLAQNFDVIFETGKFWAAELNPLFSLLFRKRMRFVFCPHGNSDKGHSLRDHVEQDISLVYGDHLADLLTRTGATQKIRHLVYTGNYRLPYYLKHQAFFDALAEKRVFQHFKNKKPVVLYAPTWQDRENPTSFFSATDFLIEQLSTHFNLVIKLHPFLIDDYPVQAFQVMERYENHPSALFLTDFPVIYPLIAHCDLYLGDYSSIGYDFLAFDKPLYFLNSSSSPLHTCGLKIPTDLTLLNDFLNSTLEQCREAFAPMRKKVYSYAFGEEVPPQELKQNIFEKLLIM